MRVSKRNIRYHVDAHHHGLFIKEARLRQGYRLSEVASEICDTSYLSKIESGAIVPTPEIFEKLAEKLGIQFPSEERLCAIEKFREFLYREDVNASKLRLTNDCFHQYEIGLIQFFQFVLSNELAKAFALKKMIDQYCHHFSSKEQQTYLLFSGLYFFKNFEWEKGKRCFKQSLDLVQQTEEDPYLYFNLAKYCFRMRKTCLGFSYLERAISEFKKNFEKDWVFKCNILWCRESVRSGDIRSVEKRLEDLRKIINPKPDHLQWSGFFNILGMICEKKGAHDQAEDYYVKSIEQRSGKINEQYIIDAVKFHYRRQNNEQLIKLIERLDLDCLSKRNRMIIDFYYFKLTDETSDYFEMFLRKDAIPFAMKAMDYRSVSLYTKELTKYYRNKLRHKKAADAYYKWERFRDELNLIRMV